MIIVCKSIMEKLLRLRVNVHETHMTNLTHSQTGGIENTLVYWLAVEIFNLNTIFCERYIDKRSRTYDQMVQAARSCKQNLVEGSLENSAESNLKLTGISRASFGELIEDYKDFLWKNNLKLWEKNDSRILSIRQRLIDIHETHVAHEAHESHEINFANAEAFANLMVTLCTKEGFLMDRFLAGIQKSFVEKGGFKENLFKKRREFQQNKIL